MHREAELPPLPMASSGRALEMISPRIKVVSAGMVARDRKERTITIDRTHPVLAMERAWEEVYGLTRTDIEALQRVFNQLKNKDGLIGPKDLEKRFIRLDYEFSQATDFGISEVEDIIWEVDEDADGFIDWHNFVQLYARARADPKNKEPRRLFNLIDFMICDKDGGGNIDEDEILDILYKRYGKESMEQLSETLLKMFGRDIDYNEFLQLVGNNIDGGGTITVLLANLQSQQPAPPAGPKSSAGGGPKAARTGKTAANLKPPATGKTGPRVRTGTGTPR